MTRTTTADPLPLRPDLATALPYGAPGLPVPVRLNTNESAHSLPAELASEIGRRIAGIGPKLNRYPDPEAVALRADLARYLSAGTGCPAGLEQIWAANGSNEIFAQLLQAFGGPGRLVLGFEPSYSVHPLLARTTGTKWLAARRADDFTLSVDSVAEAIRRHRPDVVVICSPNNPTATSVDPDVVIAAYDVAQERRPAMVVVDEAYVEFSHRPSLVPLLSGRPRLVVTRTMSKALALAGARVGYLVADPAVVDALRLVRLPYHLSTLTQEAARCALAHADQLLETVEQTKEQRDRLVDALRGFGLTVADSDANFVLFGVFADQRRVWEALVHRGVLVRDVGLPGWLRVTAGLAPEVEAFLAAVRGVAP